MEKDRSYKNSRNRVLIVVPNSPNGQNASYRNEEVNELKTKKLEYYKLNIHNFCQDLAKMRKTLTSLIKTNR